MPTESDLGRCVYPTELGHSVMGSHRVRLADESIKRLFWPTERCAEDHWSPVAVAPGAATFRLNMLPDYHVAAH